MNAETLNRAELFINRELSLLEFNRRVLEQAANENLPLLERLTFLCITSSNLDEFFEIRVSGLKQQVAYGSVQRGPDNLSPSDLLNRISETVRQIVKKQYQMLNDDILPALESKNIYFVRRDDWDTKQSNWIKRYFNHELLPVLSPVGMDPAHPFPQVSNKSLNFIVSLEGKDAFGRNSGIAILQAPRSLPRLIQLPASCASHDYDFVFLSSIIHAYVSDLFPGMQVKGCFQFRVTRNGELFVDDEEVDDLMRALEGELPSRRFADAVRLEVADNCPQEIVDYLLHQFNLQPDDVYQVSGPVNLSRLMTIPGQIDRPDLKFPGFNPGLPSRLSSSNDIFDTIRKGDVLLHHPFQSFAPVVDFLRQAAADANVLAIKQTLYRTGEGSAVVDALVEAAKAGKEVTVVIELRARFDEQENIGLANVLQAAGAHVSYGVVGHKTHAKMIMVVRREEKRLKRYAHLSTGNYHARTARLYTDYGLLTNDQAITEDVHKIFQQLTAMGRAGKLRRLLQSPFTLYKGILEFIQREIEFARAGKPARIIAKMNSLVEEQIILALYEASQAGVRIDLIVRGACCLRPGIKGVSDNIQVRSIVGRFLEHTRIFCFHNNGESQLFCSSADWMDRNFFRRVETCFPIDDKRLKQRILKEGLTTYLADNTQAWILQSDGSYKRCMPGNAKPRSAQDEILAALAD
ncbi:MAG: polyphosphate kinase [Nitrosomonas sp.]|jgi:polyphosphate kinase|nr:MAG: polyphosphate kinase [Nitrosomonas sp.]